VVKTKALTFPKVPHRLQYVCDGDHYARIKANGKIIREGTAQFSKQDKAVKTRYRPCPACLAPGSSIG
jgi:hypothetical protein